MGRVLKNVQLRVERYQLAVPDIAPPPTEPPPLDAAADVFGFGDDALLADAPLAEAPDTPAVDLVAIEEQAQALIHDASRNAEQIVADAQARARATIDDATARAAAIAQDARTRGHEEGYAAGRDAADREMNDMLGTMRGLLEMARAERHKLIEAAEPELVRLAVGIAERVLHQQLALDRGVVIEMAKIAISRLIDRDSVTVRVNPADLERMREHRDQLIALGDIRNLRVVEDQRVDRGGVVVDTEAGTIDARIGTQLDEARAVLHIDDDVVVEPAPSDGAIPKAGLPAARAS